MHFFCQLPRLLSILAHVSSSNPMKLSSFSSRSLRSFSISLHRLLSMSSIMRNSVFCVSSRTLRSSMIMSEYLPISSFSFFINLPVLSSRVRLSTSNCISTFSSSSFKSLAYLSSVSSRPFFDLASSSVSWNAISSICFTKSDSFSFLVYYFHFIILYVYIFTLSDLKLDFVFK